EAEPLYRDALRIRPGDPRAHLGYGLLLARSGRTEAAGASLAWAVELGPGDPEAHANYAVCLAQLGRADEAVKHYALALRLRPRYAVALFNLGLLLRERPGPGGLPMGIRTEADALKLAVEADPGLGLAWFHLGDALAASGVLDEAAGAYERALALMPRHADAANNLGLVRVRQLRYAEAAAAFERALQAEPGHEEARENLAAARKMLGRGQP
ncbi:MAG: tetratricopeptide repeat protein, partial [Phycisphaerales bacterium]|nr:tetratricopeptide repeat protein [Phycisphaerales bacterium]